MVHPSIQQPKKAVCASCKKPISGARTVIEGMWFCPDCTYLHDNPDKVVASQKPRKEKVTPMKLFDIPPKGDHE